MKKNFVFKFGIIGCGKIAHKRAKFIELGEKRMANAIKHIRLVGNLSDKNNYVYSDEDAALMLKALRSELATTEAKFKNSKGAQTHTLFKFPGNK